MKFLTELFFNSKIIRILAVAALIYFGLYKYDKSDDSLSRNINSETISRNYDVAKSQTIRIFDVISKVKKEQHKKENLMKIDDAKARNKLSNKKQALIDDIDRIKHSVALTSEFTPYSKDKISCNSILSYNMDILKDGVIIDSFKNKRLVVSQNKDVLLERKFIGLSSGKVIEFTIDKDAEFLSPLLRRYFLRDGNFTVRATVIRVLRNDSSLSTSNTFICK